MADYDYSVFIEYIKEIPVGSAGAYLFRVKAIVVKDGKHYEAIGEGNAVMETEDLAVSRALFRAGVKA